MLWIKNAHIIDPAQGLSEKGDVLVKKGLIIKTGGSLIPEDVMKTLDTEKLEDIIQIDAEGKYVFPGLIDAHVHLREPGQEDKEDIRSGSRAAVRGGFTAVMAMANTTPVVDSRALTEYVCLQGERADMARIFPIAAVTKGFQGKELVEMADIHNSGAVAFSDDGKGIQSAEMMRLALQYAKITGCPIISHCEDESLADHGAMRKGEMSARLGLKGIPASAESVMVARDVILAAETGGKLHIAHVSCKESVQIIREAKKMGVDITAEVNPHHLIFSEDDVTLTNTSLKVNPPLPNKEDQAALLEGLLDGTIAMFATDHAPHAWEEKARPFAEAPFGINALETILAAVWQNLILKNKLTLEKVISLWSLNPARRFGLPGGSMEPGNPADLVIFDPEYKEMIEARTMESKAQNTPFLGQELKGLPVMTIIGGKIRMRDRTLT